MPPGGLADRGRTRAACGGSLGSPVPVASTAGVMLTGRAGATTVSNHVGLTRPNPRARTAASGERPVVAALRASRDSSGSTRNARTSRPASRRRAPMRRLKSESIVICTAPSLPPPHWHPPTLAHAPHVPHPGERVRPQCPCRPYALNATLQTCEKASANTFALDPKQHA
jgi:hypothetical protein